MKLVDFLVNAKICTYQSYQTLHGKEYHIATKFRVWYEIFVVALLMKFVFLISWK